MLLCGNRHDDKTVTSDAASETIHGLKQELERCLVMYRGKREQLTEVNSALLEARNSVEDLKQRLERTEKELKETKVCGCEKRFASQDKGTVTSFLTCVIL